MRQDYQVQYDRPDPRHPGSKIRDVAHGWYRTDGCRVKGQVTHEGPMWSVQPSKLLPLKQSAMYLLKLEVEYSGAGRTCWSFEFKTADVEEDSVSMPPAVFWDKVSMASDDQGRYTFQDRDVESITINFVPRSRRPKADGFTAYNPGGAL